MTEFTYSKDNMLPSDPPRNFRGLMSQSKVPLMMGVAAIVMGVGSGIASYRMAGRDIMFRNQLTVEMAADSIVAESYADVSGSLLSIELSGGLSPKGAEVKQRIDDRYATIKDNYNHLGYSILQMERIRAAAFETPVAENVAIAYGEHLLSTDKEIRDLVQMDLDLRIADGASPEMARRETRDLTIRAGVRAHLGDLEGDRSYPGNASYESIWRASARVTISAMQAFIIDPVAAPDVVAGEFIGNHFDTTSDWPRTAIEINGKIETAISDTGWATSPLEALTAPTDEKGQKLIIEPDAAFISENVMKTAGKVAADVLLYVPLINDFYNNPSSPVLDDPFAAKADAIEHDFDVADPFDAPAPRADDEAPEFG